MSRRTPPRSREGEAPPGDDARLVDRVRRGESAAFDELVGRHLRSVYAVALATLLRPEAATVACEEAFLRALHDLDRCEEGSRFLPWLLQITRTCAAEISAADVPPGREEEAGEDPRAPRAEPAAPPGPLGGLPQAQRETILLRSIAGWRHTGAGTFPRE